MYEHKVILYKSCVELPICTFGYFSNHLLILELRLFEFLVVYNGRFCAMDEDGLLLLINHYSPSMAKL